MPSFYSLCSMSSMHVYSVTPKPITDARRFRDFAMFKCQTFPGLPSYKGSHCQIDVVFWKTISFGMNGWVEENQIELQFTWLPGPFKLWVSHHDTLETWSCTKRWFDAFQHQHHLYRPLGGAMLLRIASHCFALLRIASQCFAVLRSASQCFAVLRSASQCFAVLRSVHCGSTCPVQLLRLLQGILCLNGVVHSFS